MKSASKGFTLLEIIVVMLIISITGSLVFMSFGRGAGKKEMKIFAGKMVSVCRQARMTAVSTGVPVAFVISPEDRKCWISKNTEQEDYVPDQGVDEKKSGEEHSFKEETSDNRISVLSIPQKALIEASGLIQQDNGLYKIIFYPDGSSGGGDFAIRAGDEFSFFFKIDLLTGIVGVTLNDPDNPDTEQ